MGVAVASQRKTAGGEGERASAPSAGAPKTPAISRKALAEPARSSLLAAGALQRQGFVSSPDDAAEVEADRIAAQVVAMPEPAARSRAPAAAPVQRAAAPVPRPSASAAPPAPSAAPGPPSDATMIPAVRAAASGGAPLSRKTRAFMEPRFGADFSGVRIHTGPQASHLAKQLAARAFAYGRHIFFNDGEYQPDTPAGQKLLAHELTHTIQQREVIQRKATVQVRTVPHVQRGVLSAIGGAARAVGGAISDAAGAVVEFVGDVVQVVKDFIADKATIIPGFRLLCLILGRNPINDAASPGGGRAILQELTGFMPFGDKVLAALTAHGIIDKGGAFIDEQLAAFKRLVSSVTGALGAFFSSLGPRDAVNPGGAWDRAKSIFTAPLNELKSFAGGLVSGFVTLVREVILKPLGRWAAANVPKWDLLMAVLGKNPVSDEGESPASAVIGAFMNLIGQGEIWANIQKAKAIPRAWQWFQNALKGAKALVSQIPGLVVSTIKSLTIVDVITIAGAFRKIVGAFGSFVGSLFSWAGGTVLSLLEIILEVVAPAAVPYLKKAGGAFKSIIANPIGFVRTLVAAGKAGFQNFAGNFLTHLKAALIGWLTGSLAGAGVYIPKGFTVLELLKFVLSVLGLTWANLRAKLVRATNETTVKALETGFQIVKTLVTEGPAAAWQEIVKSLTNLKQMAIDAVMDFVKSKIVQVAVTKLLSMLSPAGAFIQALIAIYNTIMFFVERIRQIAQVAAAFIDSIAAIASGNIAPAAARVEKTLAGLLVLVISFLARLAGLGKVSDAVLGLVKKVRAPIDKALDKVVAWIVAQAKKLGKMLLGENKKPVPPAKGDKPSDGVLGKTVSFGAVDGSHKVWLDAGGQLMMASTAKPLSVHLSSFKSDASTLDDAPKKAVLGAIGSAMPIAKRIEKNSAAARKKQIGTEDRDKKDTEIEQDEELLAPHLKIVLDTLGVKVPDQLSPMSCVFTKQPHLDMGEYARQLGRQQAEINKMSVEIWLGRRMQYAEFKQQAKSEGRKVTGRDPRSAKAQREAKSATFELMIQRLMLPEKGSPLPDAYAQGIVSLIFQKYADSTRSKGLARSTAEKEVKPYSSVTAALHEPDQVVGGKFNQIGGLGDLSVNSDIGANWGKAMKKPRHLANDLEKQVKDEMRKLKISRAFWRKTKMNVVMT